MEEPTADRPPTPAEVPAADGKLERPSRSQVEREEVFARVASGLAHELKNPLWTMEINRALREEEGGGVKGRGDSRPEPTAREKRCQKRVLTLQREVQRLETIVEDFLRYARGGVIDRAPHDLGQLVKEVLDFVEPEDTRAGIRH